MRRVPIACFRLRVDDLATSSQSSESDQTQAKQSDRCRFGDDRH